MKYQPQPEMASQRKYSAKKISMKIVAESEMAESAA